MQRMEFPQNNPNSLARNIPELGINIAEAKKRHKSNQTNLFQVHHMAKMFCQEETTCLRKWKLPSI